MVATIQIKRRNSGAAGAPASLKSGELAYNAVDDVLYIGRGDDGTGEATSIVPVGGNGYFAADSDLSSLGYGDMLKSVYDTDGDGKVDAAQVADSADAVDWANVQNTPSSFPPAAHDASLITTGTIDAARLPAAAFNAPVVSSADNISGLSASEKSEIQEGSTVLLSTGVFYVYKGSGSKGDPANYVELADKTPDWSAIANKPAAFTPAAHQHAYTEITGLGTMATQDAGAVNITGGTLDGVTLNNLVLDGGSF